MPFGALMKMGSDRVGSGNEGGSTSIPLVMGAVQYGRGALKQRKADAMQPADEDPEVRMNLSRIQRQARALETGTAFSRERQGLQQLATQAGVNSARLSGGAGGAAIAGQARNTSAIAEALVKLSSEGRRASGEKDVLITGIVDKIAQRKLELNLLKQNRMLAQAAQLKKSGSANMNAALASIGKIGGKGAQNTGDTSDPTGGEISKADNGTDIESFQKMIGDRRLKEDVDMDAAFDDGGANINTQNSNTPDGLFDIGRMSATQRTA